MTIIDWLMLNMRRLGKAGVDSPRRDCLVLLEDTIGHDRAWVMAHPEQKLEDSQLAQVDLLIQRRIKREPLAYIRGKAWFYGRFFEVNENVLIPRPESEDFIDLIKEIDPKQVIDIGTGSGCLAITVKLEIPLADIIATDIDSETLKIAQKNAEDYKTSIKFVQSDLLSSVSEHVGMQTVILTNLPYVPENMVTSPEISTEPELALFSGKDGLEHYRKFWTQIYNLKTKPKYILTESLESQHSDLQNMADIAGYSHIKTRLLINLFERR